MSDSNTQKNKAIVLEAFDTLFNKRDYTAAERFWSSNYIQHSAHIEPGRDGLFNLVKAAPPSLQMFRESIGATCQGGRSRRSPAGRSRSPRFDA